MLKIGILACIGTFSIAGSAWAQSSVTLYGIVDTGVEYVSHANAQNDSVVRMPAVTGLLPSRWGLAGTEDLGGGYKTVFTLESGFNVQSGGSGQGGRLFGRQAWVGLSGPYGTLSFGRQYTMTYLAMLQNEIMGPSIYGLGSLDAYIPNARSDNTIAYIGSYAHFTFGATYSFGRDSTGTGNSPGQGTCAGSMPGNFQECHQWSAMIKYDASNFGMDASYDQQRGGQGADASFFDGVAVIPLTASGDKDTRIQANAYVKFWGATIDGGWLGRWVELTDPTIASVRSDLFFLGVHYAVTPVVILESAVYRILNKDHDTRATLGAVRGIYLLSKQTSVYGQLGYLANSAHARYSVSAGGGGTTPPAGSGQTGVMLGIEHKF